ncbi:MAG: hypothetical protein IKJ16_01875 [Agathobacter sp.]|nr:hypothetical protein [Lachnospiraceae bacterium]MBR3811066.1 hypothetical protein [Agathobacter sp.]MBR4059088.1 hypothetical protein [Lachnospiraceae bacterium]
MRILIVVGNCLKVNSSANLCHKAYIQGFIEGGHDVTVVSMSDLGQIIDESIELPIGATYFFYDSSFLLKFIKPDARKAMNQAVDNKKFSIKTKVFSVLRSSIMKFYGVFGYSQAWISNTVAQFYDGEEFDLVVSLSSPITSHVAAHLLIEQEKVKCKRFCELWEDPWQYDIYDDKIDEKLLQLEYDITRYADKVIYVSPITAKIQAELFPKSAKNIDWVNLPYYYKDEKENVKSGKNIYGYFGDYFPQTRNLAPFYKVAKKINLEVNICGMPNELFRSTETIHIYPRLSLGELKKYEDVTNVLVFVCNLRGGQIPGKIYQYSATNKKILFILDGIKEEIEIIKDFFRKYNRYYFCNNNEESILDVIHEIEDGGCEIIVDKCIEDFSPKNVCQKIIEKCMDDK